MSKLKTALLAVLLTAAQFFPAWAQTSDGEALAPLRAELQDDSSQSNKNHLLKKYADQGHLAAVSYLLNNGADINYSDRFDGLTPLLVATTGNHLEMVKLLLAKGADLRTPNSFGHNALILATLNPNPEIARVLVSQGLSVNENNSAGATPLFYAAGYGNTAMLEFLLSQGADLQLRDKDGNTPLGWAFQTGDIQNVLYLISKGADPKAQNLQGETPMFLAVAENRISLLNGVWLKTDAHLFDINHANHDGDTMLHKALRDGHPTLAHRLYYQDANPLLKNRQGQSAFWTLLDYLEGPVNPATLSPLEAGCAADSCEFLEHLDQAKAISAELDKVQANMQTVQTMVEYYAVNWGGVYAPNLEALYQDGIQEGSDYWKDFLNPFTGQSGINSALSERPITVPDPARRGQIVYWPVVNEGPIVTYKIYALDHLGRWLRGSGGTPLSLTNS